MVLLPWCPPRLPPQGKGSEGSAHPLSLPPQSPLVWDLEAPPANGPHAAPKAYAASSLRVDGVGLWGDLGVPAGVNAHASGTPAGW